MLLLAGLLAVWLINPFKTDVANSVENSEMIDTVRNYLITSSMLDWDNAYKNLTAKALENAKNNAWYVREPSALQIENISVITYNDNIAVVEADYIMDTNGMIDLAMDRFYLLNQEGWKIYRQESIPLFIGGPLNGKEDETTRMVKKVVTDYINYVGKGDHLTAIKLLTGKELEDSIKYLDSNPAKVEIIINEIKTLALGEQSAYMFADLEAEGDQYIKLLFELVFVDSWKIKKVVQLS